LPSGLVMSGIHSMHIDIKHPKQNTRTGRWERKEGRGECGVSLGEVEGAVVTLVSQKPLRLFGCVGCWIWLFDKEKEREVGS
jgi:hypothetical protein